MVSAMKVQFGKQQCHAPHFKLDNLIAISDNNNFQQTGSCSEILDTGSLQEKWETFGWETVEVDGHDTESSLKVFSQKIDSINLNDSGKDHQR